MLIIDRRILSRPVRALVLACLLLALVACSGGGGGSSFRRAADQAADGFWSGTITSDTAGQFQIAGIVTATGELQFTSIDGATVYTGTVQVDRDTITGTLEAVNFAGFLPNALPAGTIQIDGTVTSQDTITGTYTGANDSGSFSVTYNASYERSADLGKLASDWTSIGNLFFKAGIGGENDVLAITVDAAGALSGGDTSACAYDGTFGVPDPDVNAYSVQLVISNCGGLDGSYTGVATLTDDAGINDTLALSASNAAVAIAFNIDRISSRSAAGIWQGTVTSDTDMIAVPFAAIIAENDAARFVDIEGSQLAGIAEVSGNFFDSTLELFASDGTYGPILVRGLVDTATSLDLSYEGLGESGTIALTYDNAYEDGSSLATLAGDWSFVDGADILSVSIDGAGSVAGSDSDGCTYTGTVSLIDTNFNAYQVDLSAAGCAAAGDYSGLAAVLDAGDTLLVAVSSTPLEAGLSVALSRVVP